MKIGISTVGSTGDVQPYLALALGLRAAKHDVKIICHLLHVPRFQQFGLNVVGCGPEVSQQELNEMLDKMLRTRNPLKQLQQLMEEAFFAEGELYYQQAKAAFADREIALCHMVDFLGAEAAAQNGIPIIGGILAPAGIPTRYDVPPNMPKARMFDPELPEMYGMRELMRMAYKPTSPSSDSDGMPRARPNCPSSSPALPGPMGMKRPC